MNQFNISAIIKRTLLMNIIATIFVTLLNMTSGWQAAFSPRRFSFAIVYSFCIGSFCSIVLNFISPNLYSKKPLVKISLYTLLIFIAVYCGLLVGNIIFYLAGMFNARNILPMSFETLLFPLTVGLVFGGGTYFYEQSQFFLSQTQTKLQQKEIEEANAKRLATEAQLASLESRIHPHFLFNTLNSIAALIREEPILAEKTVEKLSALLRYSLDSNAKSLVSLAQELEITEKYLEIEKIRFDKRLNYKVNCEQQFLETKIPPLSLQTLVENAIKHVVAKTSEPTQINISVEENIEFVKITVSDSGAGFSEKDLQENHGLDILRKRLQTIFGDKASLQIIENTNSCVILKLPKT